MENERAESLLQTREDFEQNLQTQLEQSIKLKRSYEEDLDTEMEKIKAIIRKIIFEEERLDTLNIKIQLLKESKQKSENAQRD